MVNNIYSVHLKSIGIPDNQHDEYSDFIFYSPVDIVHMVTSFIVNILHVFHNTCLWHTCGIFTPNNLDWKGLIFLQ